MDAAAPTWSRASMSAARQRGGCRGAPHPGQCVYEIRGLAGAQRKQFCSCWRYPNAPWAPDQARWGEAQAFSSGLFKEAIAVYRETMIWSLPTSRCGIYQCFMGMRYPQPAGEVSLPLGPEARATLPRPGSGHRPRAGIDKFAGAGPAGWADYDGDGRPI
jgi:hypothetical protein